MSNSLLNKWAAEFNGNIQGNMAQLQARIRTGKLTVADWAGEGRNDEAFTLTRGFCAMRSKDVPPLGAVALAIDKFKENGTTATLTRGQALALAQVGGAIPGWVIGEVFPG